MLELRLFVSFLSDLGYYDSETSEGAMRYRGHSLLFCFPPWAGVVRNVDDLVSCLFGREDSPH